VINQVRFLLRFQISTLRCDHSSPVLTEISKTKNKVHLIFWQLYGLLFKLIRRLNSYNIEVCDRSPLRKGVTGKTAQLKFPTKKGIRDGYPFSLFLY